MFLRHARDLVDRAEIEPLRKRSIPQRQHAAVEQRLRAFLVEHRVVVHLAHPSQRGILARHGLEVVGHLVQQRVILAIDRGHRLLRRRLHVDHAHEQQRMVRGEGASGLADDVRHRQLAVAAHFREGVDDVVRVLLQRVVHARLRGGLRAVVVHAEAAADVHVRDVEAHRAQFGVEARQLLQAALDEADVGDLRSQMAVDQLHDAELAGRGQLVDDLHELGGAQAELRLLAAGLRPAAAALGAQLDAHPAFGLHAHLLRDLQQHVELADLLDDDEHLVTEPLAHEGEPHELFVLVAVADDEMVGALPQREHGLQLRLRSALETNPGRLAELDDLLHHVPLLVDLDRIHRGVAAGVRELLHRAVELRVERLDPRAEDVGESQQHRKGHALRFQVDRELEQVERAIRMVLVGPDDDVSLLVDVEESVAPALDVVQRARRVDRPAGSRLAWRRYDGGIG